MGLCLYCECLCCVHVQALHVPGMYWLALYMCVNMIIIVGIWCASLSIETPQCLVAGRKGVSNNTDALAKQTFL